MGGYFRQEANLELAARFAECKELRCQLEMAEREIERCKLTNPNSSMNPLDPCCLQAPEDGSQDVIAHR